MRPQERIPLYSGPIKEVRRIFYKKSDCVGFLNRAVRTGRTDDDNCNLERGNG